EAKRVAGARALPLDFDAFLADPQHRLVSAFRHLESVATPKAAQAILAGPLMQQDAKAPEHVHSPQLRDERLNETRATHRAEISKGRAWLDRAAGDFPLIGECLA